MGQAGGLAAPGTRPATVTKALIWSRARMLPVGWLGHLDGHPTSPWAGGFARGWSMPAADEAKLMAMIGEYTNREATLAQLVGRTDPLGDVPGGPLFVREIRVLSLRQPWAHLVVSGLKSIETRTWSTSYRGTLAIHATKGWSERDAQTCRLMASHGLPLPVPSVIALTKGARSAHFRSGIVGMVTLQHVVPMSRFHVRHALSGSLHASRALALWSALFPDEVEPGAGRFAWQTVDPVRFTNPVPYVGGLGLRGTCYRIGRGAPLEDAAPGIARAMATATRRR